MPTTDHSATLAPWIARQRDHLLQQRGHAWLLHGPSGLGQYALALEVVRAWMCEALPVDAPAAAACGRCAACHALQVHTHADVRVLMPETHLLALGWPLPEKAQAELDEKKRKPSREIRVDALRDAVEFAQRTDGRGRGKAVLVYPAEQMNTIAANTLLKTLEEPVGSVRFILATDSAHQLLPTIRSRCQSHAMQWPQTQEAQEWLQSQGLEADQALGYLRMSGQRPEDALALSRSGRSPQVWAELPKRLQCGDTSAFSDWSAPELIAVQQKICHDLWMQQVGATPRYFTAQDLPKPPGLQVLQRWWKHLGEQARTAEHPFHTALMHEALVAQAKSVLNSAAQPHRVQAPV